MRFEGPLDQVVRGVVVGPDEYVAVVLPEGTTTEMTHHVSESVRRCWPGARVLIVAGDIRLEVVEQEQAVGS